MQHKFN